METKDIRVELPREFGHEVEFFKQSDPGNTTACSAHIHSAAELLYVKEGSYTVTVDNSSSEIGEGDLILFCSGAIHYVVTGENPHNSYYVIKIPPSLFIDFARSDTGTEYAMRFALNRKENKYLWRKAELENSEIKSVLHALINEYEQNRYASEIAIKLKVMELLLSILRDDASGEMTANDQITRLIYSVMKYVQERYYEDINEKELAQKYSISYSYFSRSFKRVTGMSFKDYLNRTRISKAEQMLSLADCSVSEAAIACGYNSISYFISIYRKIMGQTPHKAVKMRR